MTASTVPNTFSMPTWLKPTDLKGMLRGVEKESLRMQPNGYLAQTAHPNALGSTLTHPHITTDYSESLLELITSPKDSIAETLEMLRELHQLVYDNLQHDELLWPLSMPCMLSVDDEDIPLGNYGTSNIGKLKTLYRNGLGLRYGRRMQTIAGLHYNLSFPDVLFEKIQAERYPELSFAEAKNAAYLGLVRNFKRLSSMVLYLLGASPCVCACFLHDRHHHLQRMANNKSLYLPNATSLRMGKLGYQNSAQDDLDIQYNNLPDYVRGLRGAISVPHADFTALGVDDDAGNPTQINDHILQIENEFYSTIRPKQVANSGESPTHALEDRGIAYIELRAVDLDPYSPVGISKHGAHFLETLALYCLLLDSPALDRAEESILSANQDAVVNSGRDEALEIQVEGNAVNFRTWMQTHLSNMLTVAETLDAVASTTQHHAAITEMLARSKDVTRTPSARVLAEIEAAGGVWDMGKQLAEQYAKDYQQTTLTDAKAKHYADMATDSLAEQVALEATPDIPFKEFVKQYR